MGTGKINDLIFKELIKRGYSLRGNTRVWNIADSKLRYLTPQQAQGYLNMLDSQAYQSDFGPKELTLIGNSTGKIVEKIGGGPLNLVDLGCGDGRKAKLLIKYLTEKNKVRYCPIDISGYMVEKAINNISKFEVDEVIESNWNISDFENLENITPLLKKGNYKKSLFLLLGNTLGNFEFHDLLYSIKSSMNGGDYLLIGNGLDNGLVESDLIKFLKDNKPFFDFYVQVPLELGLSKEDVEFDIRFENSRVEFVFILKKDVEIKFQDRKIRFEKGDQIVVGYTYHYTKEEFLKYLKIYFDEIELFASEDGSYTLALCKN